MRRLLSKKKISLPCPIFLLKFLLSGWLLTFLWSIMIFYHHGCNIRVETVSFIMMSKFFLCVFSPSLTLFICLGSFFLCLSAFGPIPPTLSMKHFIISRLENSYASVLQSQIRSWSECRHFPHKRRKRGLPLVIYLVSSERQKRERRMFLHPDILYEPAGALKIYMYLDPWKDECVQYSGKTDGQ